MASRVDRPPSLDDVLNAPGLAVAVGLFSGARASCRACAASRALAEVLGECVRSLRENCRPHIYVFGGHGGRGQGPHDAISEVHVLRPAECPQTGAGRWEALPARMPTPRIGCAAAAWDGQVYVLGGHGGGADEAALAAAECFDAAKGEWEVLPPMRQERSFLQAAAVAGLICAAGGLFGAEAPASAEAFDPAARAWRALPTPSAAAGARRHGAAAGSAGALYLFGGEDAGYRSLGSAERLDVLGGQAWEMLPRMPSARTACAAAPLEGRIYVLGGYAHGMQRPLDTLECFCTARGLWSTLASFEHPRVELAAVACACGGEVLVLGGAAHAMRCSASVECFDVVAGKWRSAPKMPLARRGGCAVAVLC